MYPSREQSDRKRVIGSEGLLPGEKAQDGAMMVLSQWPICSQNHGVMINRVYHMMIDGAKMALSPHAHKIIVYYTLPKYPNS